MHGAFVHSDSSLRCSSPLESRACCDCSTCGIPDKICLKASLCCGCEHGYNSSNTNDLVHLMRATQVASALSADNLHHCTLCRLLTLPNSDSSGPKRATKVASAMSANNLQQGTAATVQHKLHSQKNDCNATNARNLAKRQRWLASSIEATYLRML